MIVCVRREVQSREVRWLPMSLRKGRTSLQADVRARELGQQVDITDSGEVGGQGLWSSQTLMVAMPLCR